MPVSSGLRSRSALGSPSLGAARSLSAKRLHMGALANLVPQAMILPMGFLACLAVAIAGSWAYDVHTNAEMAEIESFSILGLVIQAN